MKGKSIKRAPSKGGNSPPKQANFKAGSRVCNRKSEGPKAQRNAHSKEYPVETCLRVLMYGIYP
jgi:hypothetical protein